MSTSESTVKGKFNEVVGKAKQGIGEAVGSDKMANEGAGQQVKGQAQQAWGAVKEGVNDASNDRRPAAETEGHDVREKITSTAQNMKDSVKAGIDNLRDRKAS
jgi:uncharacterized protein YjbJ (UPF0337 family)